MSIISLKSCLGNTLTSLVEEDLLARDQRFLKGSADADCLDGALELQRDRGVLETAGREFIRLSDECILEAIVVVLGDLATDTVLVEDVDQVQGRLGVNGQLTLGADDFGGVFLAGCHHARGVEVGDFAVMELHQTDGVVPVVMLAQVGLNGGDTHRRHRLDLAVLAEEPQSQVDIVDGAVHEDTTRELGVGDEEPGGVQLVAGLTAHDGGSTNSTSGHLVECITVGGIEATGETAHYFEFGLLGCCIEDGLGLLKRHVSCIAREASGGKEVKTYDLDTGRQGFLAENVLASLNGLNGLFSVHGGRGRNDDGLQAFVLQHVLVVLVCRDSVRSKVGLGPFQFRVVRSADGDKVCTGSTLQEVEGMTLAHAAQTGTANLQLSGRHCDDKGGEEECR